MPETIRAMEVGLLRDNPVPAKIMRLRSGRGTFIEIATDDLMRAVIFNAYEVQRYYDQQAPHKQALKLTEWTCAARRVSPHPCKLVGSKTRRIVALTAMRGIDCADAVELKIPIMVIGSRRDEKLHTRILTYGRLVDIVLGAQEVAPHEEIYIQCRA